MYICICKGITEKQLEEANLAVNSVTEVCKMLGVGSECGVCLSDAIANFQSKQLNQSKDTNNN